METNEVTTAQPEAAEVQAVPEVVEAAEVKAESPEVAVTVAPAKEAKSEIRKRLKLLKQAAKLNLSEQRATSIIGEVAEMLTEVKRTLRPFLCERHGTWGYVQFDRKLVETDTAELAKMGFYWSQNRNGWRRPGLGAQVGKGDSLDTIRTKYGCQQF